MCARTRSRFGGRLEPFSHVDLQLYAGRNLDIVTQAETLDPFGPVIASDYRRYTAATAIVETVERMTSEEREPSLRLYLMLVSALRALAETGRDPGAGARRVPAAVDGAVRMGAGPAANAPGATAPGPHAAFHVPSGGVLCPSCRSAGHARPAAATIALMTALSGGDWDTADGSESEHRREASGLVAALLQ